jgi:tetratricopeptide (TPR) repeat protein
LSLVIVLGFSFTSLVVSSFREKQNALAAEYYAAGTRAMEAKRPADAVDAFETALVYSRDNFQFRLKLTDALLASGATSEALVQLRSFWDQRPQDALVNLKLARLEAQRKHADEALRYYQNAIAGVWPEGSDAIQQRIDVRFESAEYLVRQGRQDQAEAALQGLATVLPTSSSEQGRLADLYLRNGDPSHALSAYQSQLNLNKNDAGAIQGAAQASFAAGSYTTAMRYLGELKPETADSRALREKLERMEALDPFARSATERVRTERTMAAFRIAVERLAGCGVPFAQAMISNEKPANAKDPAQWSGFARWAEQLSPMMSERKLRGRDDVIESTMRFAFQSEMAAQKGCGDPKLNDEALLLLARERMGAN